MNMYETVVPAHTMGIHWEVVCMDKNDHANRSSDKAADASLAPNGNFERVDSPDDFRYEGKSPSAVRVNVTSKRFAEAQFIRAESPDDLE